MRYLIAFYLTLSVSIGFSQTDSLLISEIQQYQDSENKKFSNPETTILTPKDFKTFEGLDFYPINLKYRVKASYVRTPNEKPFLMKTSTSRTPEYVKYAEAHFVIDNKKYVLNLYKNTVPYDEPGYEDYLFVPFTDATSGNGSYGGGRFLDARIPKGDSIVLDFNKAYNPYCAYNSRYSCPIPPRENNLDLKIEAGVKNFGAH